MIKRRLERVAVTLLSVAMLLSSTGIASSFAINENGVSGSTSAPSASTANSSTSVSQEGGAITTTSVTTEGGKLVSETKGTGTASDPYRIENAADFLAMQDKINLTTSADKHFVLANDIDLSEITAEDFASNRVYSGSLVSVSKSLGASSKKVYFVLDGNGHKIKGLNVTFTKGENFAIFGYVNSRSTIKNLTVDKSVLNVETDAKNCAVLACENDGTISSCEITYSVLTMRNAANAGMAVAVNGGTVTGVKVLGTQSNAGGATKSSHTLSGCGTVGGVVGHNSGKITKVSAINVGAFIDSSLSGKTVYGGIVGTTSGTVSNSFASGNVTGTKATDIVGGIAGSASNGAAFVNDYALVALRCAAGGNGLVGSGASSQMLTDCYWSSAVSGRNFSVADDVTGSGNIDSLGFKVVKVGETKTISASDLSAVWGKANVTVKGNYGKSGNGISLDAGSASARVTGVTANTSNKLEYTAEIELPSSVGAGSVTVSQYFNLPILVVSASTEGDGSESNPLGITNAAEFNLLRYADGIYAKLNKDITFEAAAFAFDGYLNGNGHTVNVKAPVFTELFGTLENVNFVAKANISSAVLGRAIGAKVMDVTVSLADGAKFNASGANSGVMFSTVSGKSVLDGCRVKANVIISGETTNFGALAGAINGKGTKVIDSGAYSNITASAKATNAAIAVGSVTASDVSFTNCYVSGKNNAGKFSFVASITAKDTSFTNIYTSKGAQSGADFANYKFIDKSQFSEWQFDCGDIAFFTGNGGKFVAEIPPVGAMEASSAADYTVSCDSSKLAAGLSVQDGKLVLSVSRAAGVVTVKGCAVTVVNKKTGLYTSVSISNGLEKDEAGNYVVTTAYDLAYISENISELNKASFVLNDDVDMSVISSFTPIGGTLVPFGGKFNGNGHTISNLKINGTSKVGLFASLEDAEISNLVIDSANVGAQGMYAAVLAGQVTGKTVIRNVTVSNSVVSAKEIYAGALVGSVDSGSFAISGVMVINSTVKSNANYVGGVAGRICGDGTANNIKVINTKLSGAEYVGGVAGLTDGKTAISDASVEKTSVQGISEVSGIAAGRGTATLTQISVADSTVSTLANSSAFTAGGIASSFASSITNAEVTGTKVIGGVASGVVGKTVADGKLSLKNIKVFASTVTADGANSTAAGVLAVHNAKGSAVISDCSVDAKTKIISASAASGIVGDITGGESAIVINSVKSLAEIADTASADATASAGLVGKISAAALNNVQVRKAYILGTVSGSKAVGGFIGLIKGIGEFDSASAMISDSVCAAQIKAESTNETVGVAIGSIENGKSVNSDNIGSIITNTVISTYFGNVPACGKATGIEKSGMTDIDKPNGAAITPSVGTLKSAEETKITLSNLPTVSGFAFDSQTGWVSEAAERIEIVSSTQDTLVLKAMHQADISIVGYYVLASDNDVRVPVHFAMKSDVRTPLKGEGTSESPYLISTAYDLESVAYYDSENKYFVLANDISFEASDFEFGGGFYNVGNGVVTIGSAESGFKGTFSGSYNGKVHSINGLKLSGNTFGGLFGATDGAVISDIILNGAKVSGINCAGILVGSAKNTVIKNITINGSSVDSTDFGGIAGLVAGRAENTTIQNVKLNNSSVSTTLNATSATVETAGGVAGVFDGTLSDIHASGVSVKSGTVAGGIIGSTAEATVSGVEFNGSVSGKTSGGIIGVLENPVGTSISNCFVGGTVDGENAAAGVIAEVGSNADYLAKAEKALISDTVVTAKATGEISAAVIGKADKNTFADKENIKTDIFSGVYYSSYQNESVFGTQELNSFQNNAFSATDLSNMKCLIGGSEKSYITLDGEKTILAEDSIRLAAGNGTYKSFELCGHSFSLASITSLPEGAVSYNAEDSSLSANGALSGAKLVFTYDNGLETVIPVSYSSVLVGSGTKSDPYTVGTADEFALMMQNGANENVYYLLTDDIDLGGVASADNFAGILDGGYHTVYDFSGEAMFSSLSGTVRNLGIAGFAVSSSKAVALGALAGTLDGATVENCVVIADVAASGKVQDAGIIAGRAVNGAKISDCITSGKVTGSAVLAAGGIVGAAENAQITNTLSTAFVSANGYVGGLIGEAEYTTLKNSVFGNMVKSAKNTSGNVAGVFADSSTAENVFFDSRTALSGNAVATGELNGARALATKELSDYVADGFSASDGYSVPKTLTGTERSAKFATAVDFASMTVRYLSGMNPGTALNYTDVRTSAEVNSNAVSVDKTNGLVITLMKNKDFGAADNAVRRYAEPAKSNSASVSYTISDTTKTLGDKLVGVMLKSKLGSEANSFSLFTRIGAAAKTIGGVSVTDGGIFVDLVLPVGYSFTVKATDAEGNELKTTDAGSDGVLVEAGDSKVVNVAVEIVKSEPEWGLRTIWSIIGK